MFPGARLAVQSVSPPERFSTTYSTDYSGPWLKPRSEARPGFTGSLQSKTLPVLLQHLCITRIDNNGSAVGSQPPSGCPLPALSTSGGSLPLSFSGEVMNADSQDGEVALQVPGAGTGLSFGLTGEGLWQNVCDHTVCFLLPAANLLGQQKVEPNRNDDVRYEEGMILLTSYKGPIGCEELLQLLQKEPRAPHLLPLPLASTPFIRLSQNTDAGTGEKCLSLPGRAGTLQSSAFLQPSLTLCSYGWKSELALSCYCGSQSGTPRGCHKCFRPQAAAAQAGGKPPPLTEYQASYAAQWAGPKI
ncbi:uncharacterized protein LOC105926269 isoform X2 [Fundulus heteroclitus]|uniref:uncharacterized protein LOC105926269 isoform X2 n=1 Tax=Fundulus heteroclitus TaxID=8078 RepID=UPI00165BC888|nr:uncharacterized protein LOC105926269 isoform X2 [Fundulus heteroclitus]